MKITKVIYEQLYPVINEPFFNVRLGGEMELQYVFEDPQLAYANLKTQADNFHRTNWPHMYSPNGILYSQPVDLQVDKQKDSDDVVRFNEGWVLVGKSLDGIEYREDAQEYLDGMPEYREYYLAKIKVSGKKNKP